MVKRDDPNYSTVHEIVVTWIEIIALLEKDKQPSVRGSEEWNRGKLHLAKELCLLTKKIKKLHLSLPHGRRILMSSYGHHITDGHAAEQVRLELRIVHVCKKCTQMRRSFYYSRVN